MTTREWRGQLYQPLETKKTIFDGNHTAEGFPLWERSKREEFRRSRISGIRRWGGGKDLGNRHALKRTRNNQKKKKKGEKLGPGVDCLSP